MTYNSQSLLDYAGRDVSFSYYLKETENAFVSFNLEPPPPTVLNLFPIQK
jgi:hypothetical protein